MKTAKAEDSWIAGSRSPNMDAQAESAHGYHSSLLGNEGTMPDLDGAIGWLNSAPLSRQSLRGKVVMVNFCLTRLSFLEFLTSRGSTEHFCRTQVCYEKLEIR